MSAGKMLHTLILHAHRLLKIRGSAN